MCYCFLRLHTFWHFCLRWELCCLFAWLCLHKRTAIPVFCLWPVNISISFNGDCLLYQCTIISGTVHFCVCSLVISSIKILLSHIHSILSVRNSNIAQRPVYWIHNPNCFGLGVSIGRTIAAIEIAGQIKFRNCIQTCNQNINWKTAINVPSWWIFPVSLICKPSLREMSTIYWYLYISIFIIDPAMIPWHFSQCFCNALVTKNVIMIMNNCVTWNLVGNSKNGYSFK